VQFGDTIQLGSLEGPALRLEAEKERRKRLAVFCQSEGDRQTRFRPGKIKVVPRSRKQLNAIDAIDEILSSLVEVTLQLTKVERGFVFLNDAAGKPKLVVGRSVDGLILQDAPQFREPLSIRLSRVHRSLF